MKTIISTGQGRLHLIESAKAIKDAGIGVKVITGWIPSSELPDGLINFMGRLVGRKNISFGLRKRSPIGFNAEKIKGCSFAEFFIQFLFLLARFKFIKRDRSAVYGWKIFGWQSKRFINEAQIFHVRSGAGQGGGITKARKLGMKIVVDHSIAHPAEAYKQLVKSNNGNNANISISPESRFWQLVLKDCNDADVILVNSEYVKNSFVENGFDSDKIEVIPLGIRPDFKKLKTDYRISKTVRLLFTGGFGRRKGAHLIVDSIEQLMSKGFNVQLDVLGAVLHDFEVPEWFLKHPNIHLHGHILQDQLKGYLQNSDIYIFPSYCEGAAQSLKEAMAAGLPAVATTQSGAPIVHGENGWIIPDHSSEALTDAILLLTNDEQLREKIGRNAAETISQEHTWENYGDKTAQLYTQLLKEEIN